jgi:post-segregation antitoxin (ccd killing protein)
MPKINVYVPDDLLARIRATDISVSPVCQRALEDEVDRMEAAQNPAFDADRIARARERMSETRNADSARNRAEGKQAGIDWGLDQATERELDWVSDLAVEHWSNLQIDVAEFPTLFPLLTTTRSYEIAADDAVPINRGDDFFDGFTEGAAEAWNAINAAE